MDPIIGGALLSAGSSLLGGLLGANSARKQQKQQIAFAREEREYNKPVNVRARAEEAGFNPLLFAGPGVGQANSGGLPAAATGHMGQAIADIGLITADAMRSKAAETSRIAELETQNKELQKKLVTQTLRPPMGGMYSQGGPSIRPPAPKSLSELDPKDVYGPRPLVPVIDAISGRRFGLAPGVADRLELKPGDTWIGEDNEALLGEVMGNVNSTGVAATNLIEKGGFTGPFYDLPIRGASIKSTSVAPKLPAGDTVDWFATSGPRAPVKPSGISQKAWDRLVKRNQAMAR